MISPPPTEWHAGYRQRLAKVDSRYRKLFAGSPEYAVVNIKTRGYCLHLGSRIEFKPGCVNGCVHRCAAGEPVAVPSTVCQTCEKWESVS